MTTQADQPARKPDLRSVELSDARELLKLLYQEGWYDRTPEELEYVLTYSRSVCFKVLLDDKIVGLLFSILTPTKICYYSGFLIDNNLRGTLDILDGVLKYETLLERLSQIRIGYADPRILPFYLDFGYKALEVYSRYAIKPHAYRPDRWDVQPMQDFDLAEVYMLNDQVLRDTRDKLITHYLGVKDARVVVARTRSGNLDGYALARVTPIGTVIGPCIAETPDAAAALVSYLRAQVPASDTVLVASEIDKADVWLRQAGIPFERQKTRSTKVIKGDEQYVENTSKIFALFGFGLT
jgi:hypothetical protein